MVLVLISQRCEVKLILERERKPEYPKGNPNKQRGPRLDSGLETMLQNVDPYDDWKIKFKRCGRNITHRVVTETVPRRNNEALCCDHASGPAEALGPIFASDMFTKIKSTK